MTNKNILKYFVKNKSIKSLLFDKIKDPRNKIISFDIFDTLLLRPYVKPTDLFLHLQKLYTQENDFCALRIQAEQEARKKQPNKEDINIYQIYEEIDTKYKHIMPLEIALEKQVLTVNKQMKEAYDLALSLGKQVIIISDMYLTKEILEDILQSKGYKHYSNFYVSSEFGVTKHSGNLFKHVIKDLDISPDNILHIGDNMHADYKAAIRHNINAVCTPKVIDSLFDANKQAKIYYSNNSNSLGASIILGVLSINLACLDENYWRKLGYMFGGPLAYAYSQWLFQQAEKDDIKDLLFIARDGYSLEKVFNIVSNNSINTHYMYAARFLKNMFFLNRTNDTLIDNSVGLNVFKNTIDNAIIYEVVNKVLCFYKDKNSFLKQNTPAVNKDNAQQGIDFINNNYKVYSNLADSEIIKYQKYLKTFMSTSKVAMVDTVTHFLSSQNLLNNILQNQDIQILGYYYSFVGEPSVLNNTYKFFQAEYGCIFNDWDLVELFLTAPEPPVYMFTNNKPLYYNVHKQEQKRIDIYPTISQGILQFANNTKNIFNNKHLFINHYDIANLFNTLSQNPTKQDKKMLSNVQHAFDGAHTMYRGIMLSWGVNQNTIKIKVIGLSMFKIIHNSNKYKLYLFNIIPLIKIVKKERKYKLYAFNIIPLIKILTSYGKYKISLFGFIPLYKKTTKYY